MSWLSIVICITQMTVILLVSGFATKRMQKHNATAAAGIGITGLLLSLCLLAMTCFGVPRLIETRIQTHEPVRHTVSSASPSDASFDRPAASGFSISTRQLVAWLDRASLSSKANPESGAIESSWLLIAYFVLCVVSLVPLCLGFLSTIWMHWSSRLVEPSSLEFLSSDETGETCIRETEFVMSPCVTAFGGNTIYLPSDWRDWPESELHAGLAHERSHLQHRDAWMRLVAQVAVAFQCLHPLARWVCREVLLSQEVAADREASCTIGKSYVRSLTQMALRLDREVQLRLKGTPRNGLFLETGVVSVSSSQLIRRIEMLKRKLNTELRPTRWTRLPSALLLVVFASCACWTLRADDPASLNSSGELAPRVASLFKPAPDHEQSFTHAPVAPWEENQPNDTGYLVLRMREMLRHPGIASLVNENLSPMLDVCWNSVSNAQAIDQRDALGLSLGNIETISGSLTTNFSVERSEDDDEITGTSELSVGKSGAKITFAEAIHHDAIVESLDKDKVYAWVKNSGPAVFKIEDQSPEEFVDGAIAVILSTGTVAKELSLSPESETVEPHNQQQLDKLKHAWNLVDGGVLTIVDSLPTTMGYVEGEDDQLYEDFLTHTTCYAIGVDFKGTSQMRIRMAYIARDGSTADQVSGALDRLLAQAEESLVELLEHEDSDQQLERMTLQQFFETKESKVVSAADGKNVVILDAILPLEAIKLIASF